MKVWIFGDSFAASTDSKSWVNLLQEKFEVHQFATNGSSEYRIWKSYQQQKNSIGINDCVLFCHTSPYRLFLKNTETMLSRLLPSHPYCDLIINDILTKKESKFIKVLNTIWDEDYFNDTYNLLVKELYDVPNSLHFTFFETDALMSFYQTWTKNKGHINHMTAEGNKIIFKQIKKWLE